MHDLIQLAREVQSHAYAPYSEYIVGAAIETVEGETYTGCNFEVSNFSNTLHAEEVAIARALVEGEREFSRIAVSSAARDGVTPCGMCCQTLAEFCDDGLFVVCDRGEDEDEEYTLGELLPGKMDQSPLA